MRILLLGLTICLLPPSPAAGANTSPVAEDVPYGVATNWIVGHRLMREGDFAGALPYLHLAYSAQPDEPLIAWDFQRALAYEGYVKDALGVLDRLVEAAPDSASWRLRRASLYLRDSQPQEALADLRELRRRGQVSLDVLGTEAAIHLQQGRAGTALDVYRDGLELLPEQRAEIYRGMARIHQETDELARIPALIDEALAAVPDDPRLWLVRIQALAMLDRHADALAAAGEADRTVLPLRPEPVGDPLDDKEALVADARSAEAAAAAVAWPEESFRHTLADHYARRGQLNLAVDVLAQLRAEGELGLAASVWLTRLLFASGRQEEAEEQAVRITGTWPDSGKGWFLRARLDESRGDWRRALERHRRAVRLDPTDPELRIALVRTLLVMAEEGLAPPPPEDGAEPEEELRRHARVAVGGVAATDAEGQLVLGYAFRRLDENKRAAELFAGAAQEPRLRRRALVQQSVCLDEDGRAGAARRVLEQLRRDYPEDAEVANSLGYFLAEKDTDLELAERLVREALAVDPNNGAYLDSLGWVFYRQGELDDAFDYLVRAVNVLPEDPVVLEHLGRVLQAMGRTTEARQTYERALSAGGDRKRLETAIDEVSGDGGGQP